jgi:hypothetical protein
MTKHTKHANAVVQRLIDTLEGLGKNDSAKLTVKTKVSFYLFIRFDERLTIMNNNSWGSYMSSMMF